MRLNDRIWVTSNQLAAEGPAFSPRVKNVARRPEQRSDAKGKGQTWAVSYSGALRYA
jgi:hypothetical protein